MKATCTWGDGPDVLLDLDGTKCILYTGPKFFHPSYARFELGFVEDGSMDLTASEALTLAYELKEAARQALELDNLCKRHDALEEEKEKQNMKEILLQDASDDGCSGYKYPEECPHDLVFDSRTNACKECVKDALDALKELKRITDYANQR